MALKLEQKREIVAEVAEQAAQALSAVTADYRGLTVSEMNELRKKARESGIYLRVVRNTLAKRALEGTAFTCLNDILNGPLLLFFGKDEPGAAARLVRDFIKEHEHLKVTGLSVSGQLLSADNLEAVAKLPSREEALSILMAVMKAPITKFVRTLAEPHAKLARTLAAIRDTKQVV
ncbi:MAG: 50S ribosomal protein L10 [Gammaproteobacteria bacterium GWE2_42_36]|nr:MAG: 50S ribosomal protein L10 [Gammaproteobacteria bacterium GWE2_42_36]HCU05831.1 50S ribosomal protein L10 [Coxiellaceae bacterium]